MPAVALQFRDNSLIPMTATALQFNSNSLIPMEIGLHSPKTEVYTVLIKQGHGTWLALPKQAGLIMYV
jgi:hypothetical protein